MEACYLSLNVKQVEISDEEGMSRWVIVCSTKYSHLQGSPVKPRVVYSSKGSYSLEVLLNKVQSGSVDRIYGATCEREVRAGHAPDQLRVCYLSWYTQLRE